MYNIKKSIFLSLDKTQKTMVCNFIRALVKKSPSLRVEEILDKFIEDEKYYFELNNPHFEFLSPLLDEESFQKEAFSYIQKCKQYYDYKLSQKPLIEKQKEFDKKKRVFLQELKMSKEKPTEKQLYYYKRLCKKYNIEMEDMTSLSKLDLKNKISEITNEHS